MEASINFRPILTAVFKEYLTQRMMDRHVVEGQTDMVNINDVRILY
jgi:hypothetical protein